LTITFFIFLFAGLIIFSVFSLEFKKSSYGNEFYLYLVFLIPIVVLLTMTGTIKKKNSKNKNWGIAGLTIFIAIGVFVVMFSLLMQVAFGGWTNESILFRNKRNSSISINEQIWDVGALGYDRNSKRVVKLKPVLKYLNQVTPVDTVSLDKTEWIFVNEDGDIH